MAAHARLKNEFMEDEKCHNFTSWLNCKLDKKFWKGMKQIGGNISIEQ